jgi:predicted dehydrogenase
VRWTEQRNFEAVLDMMVDGRLNAKPLISHHFDITEADKAYELVGGAGPSLGILLHYPGLQITSAARTVSLRAGTQAAGSPLSMVGGDAVNQKAGVSFIGAGNYATAVLIPAFKAAGAHLRSVASSAGVSGVHAGRKFGFDETTTDTNRLFSDAATNAVVITTQHDSHASFVLQALRARKNVFVEKPLCLTLGELIELEAAYKEARAHHSSVPMVMVGFNRRFAPHVQKMQALLAGAPGPKSLVMTVNAGAIPANHWTQDPEVGGGRLVGEGCHFIDLLRFLAGSPITQHQVLAMQAGTKDSFSINLRFACGSLGTFIYLANGSKEFPKERLEVFAAGRILQLDNFRQLRGYGWPGFKSMNLWSQDKGQAACAKAFCHALRTGGSSPIPFSELVEVGKVALDLGEELA